MMIFDRPDSLGVIEIAIGATFRYDALPKPAAMDNTTLEKLLRTCRKVEPFDLSDKSLTDQVMAQLPTIGSISVLAKPLPLLGMFTAMVTIAVGIGTLVAPVHQHDSHHSHQAPAPPAMNGFDSSTLLVTR